MKTENRYPETHVFLSSPYSRKIKETNYLKKSNANSKIYNIDEDNEDKRVYREIDIGFLSSFLSSKCLHVFTLNRLVVNSHRYNNQSIIRLSRTGGIK